MSIIRYKLIQFLDPLFLVRDFFFNFSFPISNFLYQIGVLLKIWKNLLFLCLPFSLLLFQLLNFLTNFNQNKALHFFSSCCTFSWICLINLKWIIWHDIKTLILFWWLWGILILWFTDIDYTTVHFVSDDLGLRFIEELLVIGYTLWLQS